MRGNRHRPSGGQKVVHPGVQRKGGVRRRIERVRSGLEKRLPGDKTPWPHLARDLVRAFGGEERPAGERHPAAVVDDALANLSDGRGLACRARIKNARPSHAAFLRYGVPAAVDEASHLRSGYAARAPRAASGSESGVVGAGRLDEESADT